MLKRWKRQWNPLDHCEDYGAAADRRRDRGEAGHKRGSTIVSRTMAKERDAMAPDYLQTNHETAWRYRSTIADTVARYWDEVRQAESAGTAFDALEIPF